MDTNYIKGIAKASFCDVKERQRYISLAHFLSLQPRECMKVKDEFSPDGMIINKKLYFWVPTPPSKNPQQYIADSHAKLTELSKYDFDEIIIDVRNNIGGVLSTVIDAIYPIIQDRINGEYMYGVDNKSKKIASFTLSGGVHTISVRGVPISDVMTECQSIPAKPISVICNRYTMSTGEIVCMIVRKLGGTVYGERTRGLTNGMEIISSDTVKSVWVPVYTLCMDGVKYDGVIPDRPESQVIKYLKN